MQCVWVHKWPATIAVHLGAPYNHMIDLSCAYFPPAMFISTKIYWQVTFNPRMSPEKRGLWSREHCQSDFYSNTHPSLFKQHITNGNQLLFTQLYRKMCWWENRENSTGRVGQTDGKCHSAKMSQWQQVFFGSTPRLKLPPAPSDSRWC